MAPGKLFITLFCALAVLAGAQVRAEETSKIVIDESKRILTLYENDKVVKQYPVGLGRKGYPTPEGTFFVFHKVINPGWEQPYLKPGQLRIAPATAQNPLGTRWIGFKQNPTYEFGIHGTNDPKSIGKYSTHGCVRMRIKDAEDLYDRVEIGTPVIISPQPASVGGETHKIISTRI